MVLGTTMGFMGRPQARAQGGRGGGGGARLDRRVGPAKGCLWQCRCWKLHVFHKSYHSTHTNRIMFNGCRQQPTWAVIACRYIQHTMHPAIPPYPAVCATLHVTATVSIGTS